MCNNYSFEEIVKVAVLSTNEFNSLNLKSATVTFYSGMLLIYEDFHLGILINSKIREKIFFRIKLISEIYQIAIPTKCIKVKLEWSYHDIIAAVHDWEKLANTVCYSCCDS